MESKIFIGYERVAYYSKEDKDLRITFDSNIRFRQYDLFLSKGDYGSRILKDNEIIMEIKVPGAMPLWLCRLLSENKIYPISFSKYGYWYQELGWVS